jgi:hypothetical protein
MRQKPQLASTWGVRIVFVGVVTLVLGLGWFGIQAARPLFLIGAAAVAWLAWRTAPSLHVEMAVFFFAIAPFVRRIIDFGCGAYDETSLVLAAPLIVILLPAIDVLKSLFTFRRMRDEIVPFLLAAACILWGFAISSTSGRLFEGMAALLKWFAPLVYGLWALEAAQRNPSVIRSAARAFRISVPVLGLYGIYQYIAPPDWDQMWMYFSRLSSIGYPEPYQVRVFSMLNSPASYAVFAGCGLLVFAFEGVGWRAVMLAIPSSIGLLLSLNRAGWIGIGCGLLFCTLFPATRGRAIGIMMCLAVVGAFVTTHEPFQEVISSRLETFTALTEDGSGLARLRQSRDFYDVSDDRIAGTGLDFTAEDGLIDGTMLLVLHNLGIIAGGFFLIAMAWAGMQACQQLGQEAVPLRIVSGAVTVGNLIQIPLQSIHVGEMGFLFWLFVALATATPALQNTSYPITASRLPQG